MIIRGARQVGKSFSITRFGEKHFEAVCVIDLEKKPEIKSAFTSLDPKLIIAQLELRMNLEIIPGKTLLFIDEIQNSPNALQSLRYFKEQLPELHVIAAGSLLEFSLDDISFSFPVGRVQFMYMKPISFEEFLNAMGLEKWSKLLPSISLKNPLPLDLHHEFLKHVNQYFFIGGMPEIISSYSLNNSYLKCSRLQEAILTAYLEDFGKYADKFDHQYLRLLFEKAPEFIGKHVKYSKIDPSIKRPDIVFKKVISQLSKAGLIHQVFCTAGNGLPLRSEKNIKKFKLLYLDIGLLQNVMGIDPNYLQSEQSMLINRGALAEQFVGQEILANLDSYLNRKLYFWEREKRGSEAEVDYLFGFHGVPIPIEVKAGKTGRLRSIQQFLKDKNGKIGIRISSNPLSFERNVLSIPFYMIGQISRILSEFL